MKKIIVIRIGYLALIALVAGCTEFLSVRPDKQMAVLQNLTDLQELLDYLQVFIYEPNAFETGADNYYLTNVGFNSLSEGDRAFYTWEEGREDTRWNTYYQRIYYCNQVLASLEEIDVNGQTSLAREIKGAAHFWRGY